MQMFRYLHKVSSTFLGQKKSAVILTKESYPTEDTALSISGADRTITNTIPATAFPCSHLACPATHEMQIAHNGRESPGGENWFASLR